MNALGNETVLNEMNDDCRSKLMYYINNFMDDNGTGGVMLYLSGSDFNDLGRYQDCLG